MEKNEIMTDENQLSSEEIKKLRDLIDTEEIKKLRLKYSYHMDARELDELMDVFADVQYVGTDLTVIGRVRKQYTIITKKPLKIQLTHLL